MCFYGTDDTLCDAGEMADWSRSTSGVFTLRPQPGGHLFHLASTDVLAQLGRALADERARPA